MAKYDRNTIIKFFQAKGVSKDCPRCGTDFWNMPEDFGRWGSIVSLDDQGVTRLRSVAMITCDNCGFVSLHGEEYIAEWVETQSAENK